MTLLVISPDYLSHYTPIAAAASCARAAGEHVVVATGTSLRHRVIGDGFEWRELRIGPSSNSGIVESDQSIMRFIEATRLRSIESEICSGSRCERRVGSSPC